jgi:hypothetical protein
VLLDQRLEAIVEVTGDGSHAQSGRPYHEVRLVSEDGQTLQLFEGQLKEIPPIRLEVGKRYKLVLRPFVNNKWIELKVTSLTPAP